MPLEIERKFLVVSDEYKEISKSVKIKQAYLSVSENMAIRVRIEGIQASINIKSKKTERINYEYEYIIQKPVMGMAKILKMIDTVIVDGSLNGLGKLTMACSKKMQNIQSGQIQHYAMVMVAGFIALIVIIMVLP